MSNTVQIPALFRLAFDDGNLADQSAGGLAVTHGSPESIVDGGYRLNGQHVRDGGNYIGIERNDALFSRDEMSISLKFQAAEPGAGGNLFRIHQALEIDVTDDGQVAFNLRENSVGENGIIKSSGLDVADGGWHQLVLTYDAPAGVMRGYVDGAAVGEIAVSGATKAAQSWDPMIGQPWGKGFVGSVDEFVISERALTAEEVSQLYNGPVAGPGPQDPGPENPGTQDPGPQNPGPQDPGPQNPGPQEPAPEIPALFRLAFDDGALADQSASGLAVTHGSPESIVDGGYRLNGQHVRDGGNHIGIERNDALFSRDEMSISLKFQAAEPGAGGSLFRIHQALHIDATADGQIVFNLHKNGVGESGVIRSEGLDVTDGGWHQLVLTYDAPAGVMRGYVDGAAVGEIAISGATKGAESWDPMIGTPWGNGFVGSVDEFVVSERALTSAEVSQLYNGPVAGPAPQDPGPENPGTQEPGPQNPGPQDPGPQNPGPQEPAPESPALFRLTFDNGNLADQSASGFAVTHGSADSVVNGGYLLNGQHVNQGGNYIGVERNDALFSRDEMTISLDFKSAEPGAGGNLFRIHKALEIDVTGDGQVVFNLRENSVGENGIIKSSGLDVADGQWHKLTLAYDAPAGVMRGYVDGAAVGEIAVSGATKAAQSWDPMIGNPWGSGFRGSVDNFEIRDTVGPVSNVPSPVAGSDHADTEEDTPLTISAADLLANDDSPDGSALTITDVRLVSGNSTVELDSNGDVLYTPSPDANGPAQVEYTVENAQGGRATGTININVTPVNDAPTATGGAFQVANSVAAGTVVGTIAASDVDGDALSFAITGGNSNGAFAIGDDGRIVVANSASLESAGSGLHDLTVEVSDPAGASTTVGAQVTVTKAAPLPEPEQPNPSGSIIVGDSASFVSALKNATGGETILLKPGNYSGVIKGVDPSSTVVVTSLDPTKLANITMLDLNGASNVTFQNLSFEFKGTPAKVQFDIRVTNTDNIRFTDSTFEGVATDYAAVGAPRGQFMALVRESQNFTFDNNDVSGYMHGLSVQKSSNISIHNNDIHHMQGDGLRFAQVQNITIEDNLLREFYGADPKVTHGDFLQFWTTNTTAPSTDITIRGNAFLSGDARGEFSPQAIFFRDQVGDTHDPANPLRYQNVLIEENVIYNNHHHGISPSPADGLIVRGNTLIAHPDAGRHDTSINITNSTGVQVYDNVTPRLNIGSDNKIVKVDGNIAYLQDAGFVEKEFVNAMKGGGATLADLQVNPSGSLVKSDGSVYGSEQLNPSASFSTFSLASEPLVTGFADEQRVGTLQDPATEFQVMQAVLDDGDQQLAPSVEPADSVVGFDDGSAVRSPDHGDIWPA